MPTLSPILQFDGITKRFHDVTVLHGVSFTLVQGRTLGVVGENGAGKSTLMNILGGNLRADSGSMTLNGQPYRPESPRHASENGIAFIHQELNLFTNLTIAENIHIDSFPRRWRLTPWIHRRQLREQTRRLLDQIGLQLDPGTLVENLSAGERQLVEIAKALSFDAKLILLDEPTTSLTDRESRRLFLIMERLKSNGISMIYISHNLNDVLNTCDDILVLRDGRVVAENPTTRFDVNSLITLMVGREITQLFPKRTRPPATDVLLEADEVSQPGVVHDINFRLHQGEVLGIAGLMGSGRSELARILFGLDPAASGVIRLHGTPIGHLAIHDRIRLGLAFLTEERHSEGLCLEASIADNIGLVSLPRHARPPLGWINRTALRQGIDHIRDSVKLTPTAQNIHPAKTLSGGNQQKLVLAKWLLNNPGVFILDEPTRGIDVGAKYEVYRLINQLAESGAGVLIISSEIEELIGMCDRVMVMNQGKIVQTFDRNAFDREHMLHAAFHQPSHGAQPAERTPLTP